MHETIGSSRITAERCMKYCQLRTRNIRLVDENGQWIYISELARIDTVQTTQTVECLMSCREPKHSGN